jgi:hypothetical protein
VDTTLGATLAAAVLMACLLMAAAAGLGYLGAVAYQCWSTGKGWQLILSQWLRLIMAALITPGNVWVAFLVWTFRFRAWPLRRSVRREESARIDNA